LNMLHSRINKCGISSGRITTIIFAAIIWLILNPAAFGQVNTEKLRRGLDDDGFDGAVEAAYSVTKGNSDLVEFGLAPGFVWRSGKHQTFMINELETTSSDGADLINNGFSHLRYNYELHRRWVYEAFLQAQYNKSQDLVARYLAGSGVRLNLLRRNSTHGAVGITAMYEYEELDSGEITRIMRGSNYLSGRIERPEKWSLSATAYIQPRLSDWSDIRVLADLALDVGLSRHLSLTNTVGYRYDSEPPDGIKEYDLKVKGGLKIGF